MVFLGKIVFYLLIKYVNFRCKSIEIGSVINFCSVETVNNVAVVAVLMANAQRVSILAKYELKNHFGFSLTAYDDCILVEYPCIDEYCPPGFECYMYKPSASCVGCGLQRACRPFTTQTPAIPRTSNV